MAERETGTYVGISVTDTRADGRTEIKTRTAALGIWEGLSDSNCFESVRRQFQVEM